MNYTDILGKWIEDYCTRHHYIIMEIDYGKRNVFYFLEGQEQTMFDDYTNFDYTEVDLFK